MRHVLPVAARLLLPAAWSLFLKFLLLLMVVVILLLIRSVEFPAKKPTAGVEDTYQLNHHQVK